MATAGAGARAGGGHAGGMHIASARLYALGVWQLAPTHQHVFLHKKNAIFLIFFLQFLYFFLFFFKFNRIFKLFEFLTKQA